MNRTINKLFATMMAVAVVFDSASLNVFGTSYEDLIIDDCYESSDTPVAEQVNDIAEDASSTDIDTDVDMTISDSYDDDIETADELLLSAASGTWGALSWSIDDAGKLTISGNGEIVTMDNGSTGSWLDNRQDIIRVVLSGQITKIGNGAFSGCTNLISISFSNNVAYIGSYAFENCRSLTSLSIPNSVLNIGDHAFYECSGLQSITLPAHLNGIEEYTFNGCSSLTSLVIPETVSYIGSDVFNGCDNLESITLPDSIDLLAGDALYSCTKIKTAGPVGGDYDAQIGWKTTIPSNGLHFCNLESVVIPDGITELDDSVFNGIDKSNGYTEVSDPCLKLESVSLPSGLRRIGASTFKGCSSLTNIDLPDSLETIGESAFDGCTSLTEITLPRSLTTLGRSAFNNCYNIEMVTMCEGLKAIEGGAFINCSSLTEIELPEGLISLGESAFWGCGSLVRLTIPNSLTELGYDLVSNCYSLKDIYYGSTESRWLKLIDDPSMMILPTGCTVHFSDHIADGKCNDDVSWYIYENGNLEISGSGSIDDYESAHDVPWASCAEDIKSIVVNSGITRIGNNAFSNLTNAASISISTTVTNIGSNIIAYDVQISRIIIPINLVSIDDAALAGAYGLTEVTNNSDIDVILPVPATGHWIEKNASDRESIDRIKQAQAIVVNEYSIIYDGKGCTGTPTTVRKYYTIGETYTIDECTFTRNGFNFACWNSSSNGLGTEYKPGDEFTDLLEDGGSLHLYAIWQSESSLITSGKCGENLQWKLFENGLLLICGSGEMTNYNSTTPPWMAYADSIVALEIEEGVTTIGVSAFANLTKLSTVSIGKDVFAVYMLAFSGDTGLTEFTIPDTVTTIGANVLKDCVNIESLTVPQLAYTDQTLARVFSGNSYMDSTSKYSKLKSVTITSAETITNNAFRNWEYLEEINIESDYTTIGDYAFSNIGLKSFHIAATVTSIGEGAFQDSTALESIIIPQSTKSVGRYAFQGCSSLSAVTINEGVESIGQSAFRGCSSLTEMTFPDSVESIGVYVLNECYKIESVTTPKLAYTDETLARLFTGSIYFENPSPYTQLKKVTITKSTSISNNAFRNWNNIEEVVIPATTTSIGDYAFQNCASLKSINIPDTLQNLGEGAFQDCTSLETATVPASVTKIGSYAFQGCTALSSVIICDGVKSIGQSAFRGCSSLTEMTFPDSVESFGTYVLNECYKIESVTTPKLAYTDETLARMFSGEIYYTNSSPYVNLKTVTITQSTVIRNNAFKNWNKLEEVILPDDITSIGESAFEGCSSLESIELAATIETLGRYAFKNCTSLTCADIPEGITLIPSQLFYGCSLLSSVTLPSTLKTIESYSFYNCRSIEAIGLPDGLESIGYIAFGGCSSLKALIIPDTVTQLTGEIIKGAFSIEEIVTPDLPRIAQGTTNRALKGFFLYDGSSQTGSVDLSKYPHLRKITITQADTLDREAFSDGMYLEEIILPDDIEEIGILAFSGCTKLPTITLPSKLTRISESMFYRSGITSIDIPESVTAIEANAFSACSGLNRIVIPENVVSIGAYAFSDATAIENIYFEGDCPSIASNSFKNVVANAYHVSTNPTWTYDKKQNYGGDLTWKLYCISHVENPAIDENFVLPTCTVAGSHDSVIYCANCESELSRTLIVDPALGHELKLIKAKAASYTESGWIEHYRCDRCDALFKDVAGTIPYNESDVIIPIIELTESGDCGQRLTWRLYDDGILYIDGEGTMASYTDADSVPWHSHRTTIKKVVIANSVTSIGDYAFAELRSADSFVTPQTITRIGTCSFKNSGITEIEIGDTANVIGEAAFSGCTALRHVVLPESLDAISQSLFDGCSNLSDITLPKTITSIGNNAFFGCSSLLAAIIPLSVTEIGESVFANCSNLSRVIVPYIVRSISDSAFESSNNVVIYGAKGSYAESFANSHALPFEEHDHNSSIIPRSITPATLDSDGYVSGVCEYCNCAVSSVISRILRMELSCYEYNYDGEAKCPETVLYDANNNVIPSEHYSATYSNNMLGTATATISMNSRYYKGTLSESFVIIREKEPVAKPVANVADGDDVQVGTKIRLSSSDYADAIYYTLDGAVPTENASLYLDAIDISALTPHSSNIITLKAIAVKKDYPSSEVLTLRLNFIDESDDWGEVSIDDAHQSGYLVPNDIPEQLWISGASDQNYSGDAIVFDNLHVYFGKILLTPGKDYSVKYTNNKSAGQATITVTGKNNFNGKLIQHFNIVPLNIGFAEIPDIFLSANGKVQYGTTPVSYYLNGKRITLKAGTDYKYEYLETRAGAYKDASDTPYVVTITGQGNFTGTTTFDETITELIPITKIKITKIKDQQYSGNPIRPEVVLGGGKLKEGTDYLVEYRNNTDVGEATVIISGINSYAGRSTTTFKINGTPLSKAKMIGFVSSFEYDGTAKKQNVTLIATIGKGSASRTDYLMENYDYTVSYQDNIDVGKATVVYTGIKGYTGSIKKTYSITGKPIKKAIITGIDLSVPYVGKTTIQNHYKLFYTGTSGTAELHEDVDYVVTYSNNTNAGKNKASIIFTGINGYTGSIQKKYSIDAYELNQNTAIFNRIGEIAYEKGGAVPQTVITVEMDGDKYELTKGVDYTCKLKNNASISIGNSKYPSITVTGKGNFKGTLTQEFQIVSSDLDRNTVATATDITYKNKPGICKPKVVITDANGKALSVGKDYEKNIVYRYASPTTVTQSTKGNIVQVNRLEGDIVDTKDIIPTRTVIRATVTGKGNYHGTKDVYFRYVTGDMGKAKISIAPQPYTGKAIEPAKSDITVIIGGVELKDTEYEIVDISNNIQKGKAKIVLKGLGNFGGTKSVNFNIVSRPIN